LTFAAAALTTATLSLDATVVLLTPVVAAAATASRVSPRPMVHACARLANSASLLLPVSNLTNLLALPFLAGVSFLGFAVRMAPVWVAVLAVEYVGHRIFFRRDLAIPAADDARVAPVALPVVPLVLVGLMLVAFAVLSPLGVQPAWVAAVAAVSLSAYAVSRRRVYLGTVRRALHLPFAVFVLCLGVVVAGLTDTFLGDLVRELVPGQAGLVGLLAVALLATVLANVVNNLPATLLVVPLVAPLGVTAVLAALVGLGCRLGPDLHGFAGQPAVAPDTDPARRNRQRPGVPPARGARHAPGRRGGRRRALGLVGRDRLAVVA
jgi:arsenical pump membrane protein